MNNVTNENYKDNKNLEDRLSYIWDNSNTMVDVLLRKLGISKKNFKLIKKELGKDGFIDRCLTLSIPYEIHGIVNEYFEKYIEMPDEELEKLIKNDEDDLYAIIGAEIDIKFREVFSTCSYTKNIGKADEIKHRDAFIDWEDLSTGWIMSVGFNTSKYFYTFLNLIPIDEECTLQQYIVDTTGNTILAKLIDDIDPDKIDSIFHPNILRVFSSWISSKIWSILSPKYINNEQLIKTTEGIAVYRTSNKRSAKSCKDIFEALNKHFRGINIEIYKEIYIDTDNRIVYKHDIVSGDKFNSYNVQADSQLSLIKYYKGLKGEKLKDTDLIFETNGEIVKAYDKSRMKFRCLTSNE